MAQWLPQPPQTNEVGRATALFGGLLQLPGELPVRLVEGTTTVLWHSAMWQYVAAEEQGAILRLLGTTRAHGLPTTWQ